MKAPGWLVMERPRVEGGSIVFDTRVRTWHPGFWWFALRTIVPTVIRRLRSR
jgi:hypothetical protein